MNPFRRPNDRYGSSAPGRDALSARQPGVGPPHRRAGDPGAQLAADGLRRLGRGGALARRRPDLPGQQHPTSPPMSCRSTNTPGRGGSSWPGRAYTPTTAEIGYFLADWVTRTRSKSIDPIVIRDNWTGAYRFVVGPAIGQLNDYAKTHDPFANAGTPGGQRRDRLGPRRAAPTTYQVQWRETTFDQGASAPRTVNWTGLFTTKIDPPKNEAELRANPLGVFITAFQWSREL